MHEDEEGKRRRIEEERKEEDRSNQINHYLLSITSQVFELKYLFVRFFCPKQNLQQDDGSDISSFPLFFFSPLLDFSTFHFKQPTKTVREMFFPFKDTPNKKIESRVARKGRP